MTFPNDETGQILAEMLQAGIDLTISHQVVFFHLFEQKQQAEAMADFIKQNHPEMSINLHADETPNVWDLDCSTLMLPTHENIMKQEAEFEKIAAKFSGYNDGWGVEA
jgi:hypothetical protein